MLSLSERRRIIDLINREVVPAIGCTEPIAVALCTARAAETLGARPERIAVRLSANILKNAMGVGIPGTGMIGLPIAVALGALVGRSEYRLEVLRDVTPEAVERGREMIGRRCISIGLKEGVCEKLYIEAEVEAAGHRAVAVIAGGGWLMMGGRMDYVDLITFSLYITTFITPVRKLTNFAELFSNGFAGLQLCADGVRVAPFLPEGWTGLKFSFQFRGSRLRFEMEGGEYRVRLISGGPVSVFTQEDAVCLKHPGDEARGKTR